MPHFHSAFEKNCPNNRLQRLRKFVSAIEFFLLQLAFFGAAKLQFWKFSSYLLKQYFFYHIHNSGQLTYIVSRAKQSYVATESWCEIEQLWNDSKERRSNSAFRQWFQFRFWQCLWGWRWYHTGVCVCVCLCVFVCVCVWVLTQNSLQIHFTIGNSTD